MNSEEVIVNSLIIASMKWKIQTQLNLYSTVTFGERFWISNELLILSIFYWYIWYYQYDKSSIVNFWYYEPLVNTDTDSEILKPTLEF